MMKSLAKLEVFKLDKKQMNVLGGKGYMCADNQREFYCMTDWRHGYDIDNGATVCGWDNLEAQDRLRDVYRDQGVGKDYKHIFCY